MHEEGHQDRLFVQTETLTPEVVNGRVQEGDWAMQVCVTLGRIHLPEGESEYRLRPQHQGSPKPPEVLPPVGDYPRQVEDPQPGRQECPSCHLI